MSNKFGASSDHFGILALDNSGPDGDKLSDILVVVGAPSAPIALTTVEARDEKGDIAEEAHHGNAGFTRLEASNTFALKTGTLKTADLLVGEIEAGKCIESLSISTSNDGWPQIEVSGKLGLNTMCEEDAQTFTLPAFDVKGCKLAQPFGFTADADTKLTSCTLTATCEHAQQDNGVGEPVADGVSGGTLECTAEIVGITADPGWNVTLDNPDKVVTQEPGSDEGQAAWHTGTGTWRSILARDTLPAG
jgi:hypothetical protein